MPKKTNSPCTICGQPANNRGRCPKHTRPIAHQRGYNAQHKALRTHWQARLDHYGWLPCSRCTNPIYKGQRWDLGHSLDRTKYLGPEHAHCNRSAAKKGHQ